MEPRNNPVLYCLRQIYTIQCTRLVFLAQQPNLVCFPSLIPCSFDASPFPSDAFSFRCHSPFPPSVLAPAPERFRPNTPRDGKIQVSRMMRLSRLSVPDIQQRPRRNPIMQRIQSAFALRLGATHCGTAVTHEPLEDAVHPRHHRRLAGWPGRGQLVLLSFPSKRPAAVAGKVTSSSSPDGENHPCAPAICNSKQRFAGRAAFFADRRT